MTSMPEARQAFQQLFRPGSSAIPVVAPNIFEAEEALLADLPYDADTDFDDQTMSNGKMVIEAIAQAVSTARRQQAESNLGVTVTGRVLIEQLHGLLGDTVGTGGE